MDPASLLVTGAFMMSVTYFIGALRRQRRAERAWMVVAKVLGGQYEAGHAAAPDRVALRIDGVDVEILESSERNSAGRPLPTVTRVRAQAAGITGWRAQLLVRAPARGGLVYEASSDDALVRAWVSPEARVRLRDARGYSFRLDAGAVVAERSGLDDDPDRLVAVAGAVAALALGGRALATRWRLTLDALGAEIVAATLRDWPASGLGVQLTTQGAAPVRIGVAPPAPGEPLVTSVGVERVGGRGVRFALARSEQMHGFADVPAAPVPGAPGWWLRGKQAADVAACLSRRTRDLLVREWPADVLICVVGPRAWIEWPGVEPDAASLRAAVELVTPFASGAEDGPYR